jgi:translation initiation factor 1
VRTQGGTLDPAIMKIAISAGTVYSTEQGRICPDCTRPVAVCSCRWQGTSRTLDGIVRVGRENKGRKGKGVTIVTGLPLEQEKLRDLAKQLKQQCSSGGTVKDGVIEIQGDHWDTIVQELKKRGDTVRAVN